MATTEFLKYKNKGAYHWAALSKNIRVHDAYTACRYSVVRDMANIKQDESVLDLGCGDGALTFMLYSDASLGTITGVEPSEHGRNLARSRLRKMGVKIEISGSIEKISTMSQDVVICAEVIEHVEKPEELVKEIHRVLKPGGRLVISTPIRLLESPRDPEHVREFFPSEFVQIISRHFHVIQHRKCCAILATELYYLRPRILLRRGVVKLIFNIMSAWFKMNPFDFVVSRFGYYSVQAVSGIKK